MEQTPCAMTRSTEADQIDVKPEDAFGVHLGFEAMYSVGCMTNTAASSSAPYQQEDSLRDRARQAIATGDQAAPRALLHQLFVEEPDDGLSAAPTDAVVATASVDGDAAARERYQRTQRELHDVLGWLDTVRIYAQPDMDALERAAATLERSDASSP
jgi:hypothetical protein